MWLCLEAFGPRKKRKYRDVCWLSQACMSHSVYNGFWCRPEGALQFAGCWAPQVVLGKVLSLLWVVLCLSRAQSSLSEVTRLHRSRWLCECLKPMPSYTGNPCSSCSVHTLLLCLPLGVAIQMDPSLLTLCRGVLVEIRRYCICSIFSFWIIFYSVLRLIFLYLDECRLLRGQIEWWYCFEVFMQEMYFWFIFSLHASRVHICSDVRTYTAV